MWRSGAKRSSTRRSGWRAWEAGIDLSSGQLIVSENMREMLALDASPTTREALLERLHPDDRRVIEDELMADEAKGFVGPLDIRATFPGGSVRQLSLLARPVQAHAGRHVRLRGTVKDVSKERRAEAELRRSEERFRQGFDHAPIGMVLVDPQTLRYVRINDAFYRMVGRTRETLMEMSFEDISHRDDVVADRAGADRLAAEALDYYVTEKRYVRPDGSEVWASVNITAVRDLDSGVDVLFGQMVDITERRGTKPRYAMSSTRSRGSARSRGAPRWRRGGGRDPLAFGLARVTLIAPALSERLPRDGSGESEVG
jgi:PAS domain S-box-containing protein